VKKLLYAVVAALCLPAIAQTTWYVRPDGGTRYSVNVPTGQCDGKGDSAPTAGVVNGHCAFKDVRMLWQDGSYNTATSFPAWGWVIAGGDTAIIRGSLGTGVTYRVGWNGPIYDGMGIAGDSIDSGAPPPPSGTASQHTRILGENYASCHTASAKTQLHGGWGAFNVLDLHGVSYVDVACLDITDFSACGRANQAVGCDATQDFSQVGVKFSNTSTSDTLTDVHIHGLAGSGLYGPTGDGVVLSYVDIIGNASSGWNTDDGTTGVGKLLVQNYNITGNGCAEQYPLVWPAANSIGDCTDQGGGGYGDGFGTSTQNSPAPGWQVQFDKGTVSYNTQDGLDALHIGGPGSSMTITNTLAYGSEGEQLKVGGATANLRGNIINGNCFAMSPGNQIAGFTPTAFKALNTLCRAGNVAALINVTPGYPATFEGNTVFSQGSIGLEVEYALGVTDPGNTLKYVDNIFVGFLNAGAGENPTPIYGTKGIDMLSNSGSSWTNNSYFGFRSNWPCPHPGESAALCGDPGLADETYHAIGYGNVGLASSTSAVGAAGVSLPEMPTDFTGKVEPVPQPIGALALGSVFTGFDPPNTTVVTTPPPPQPTSTGWFSATPQIVDGNAVTFVSPATVRYGQDASTCLASFMSCVAGQPSPACWLPSVAITTTATPVTVGTAWAGSDPCPGVMKQFEIQETATVQAVTVTSNGVTSTVTVPALAGSTPPPPPVVPVAPTLTWTPASLVVTSALTAAQLNATASTPGVFTYTPALGHYLPMGTSTLTVSFAPTDTVHFKSASKTASLSVTAPPVPAPASVTCTSSAVGGKITITCK
jgi:hypothetical protein